MTGSFTLKRGYRNHPLFENEKFSRSDAWVWLIENACWRPRKYDVAGKLILLERGQLCVSLRQCADVWGWSKSSVSRFFTRLNTETMIGTDSGTGKFVITICNYDKYQLSPKEGGTASGTRYGTAAGQQRDTKEEGNKDNKEPNGSIGVDTREKNSDIFVCPAGVDKSVWKDFLKNRKAKRLQNTETAYRGVLRELAKLTDDDWPPGRLMEAIVEKGWGGIYDPRPKQGNNGNGTGTSNAKQRDGFVEAIDVARENIRDRDDLQQRQVDERGQDRIANVC